MFHRSSSFHPAALTNAPGRCFKVLAIFLLTAAFLVLSSPFHCQATSPLSARQALALLPFLFFDNTPFPLSVRDRDQLVREGVSRNWQISVDTPDLLELKSMDASSRVTLRLFRTRTNAVAAFHTRDEDYASVSELWRMDRNGHAVPLALPPDPSAEDFFLPGTPLPHHLSVMCTYNVSDYGLEALPVFTCDGRPCRLDPDKAIFFLWNGRHFVRKIKSLH